MYYAIISLLLAIAIAFGRHAAVIGRVKSALWFFRHFEIKRRVFCLAAVGFGAVALWQYAQEQWIVGLVITSFALVGFAFFFDMKRTFPEIVEVKRQRFEKAGVSKETPVVGVEFDGVAVAYPMDVVIPRHLINDRINGHPILVSFCAICQSALVFDGQVDGTDHDFKVAGVWRRNMIIHDSKTYSLWQQATGECIYGPLKGQQLKLLSGENTLLGAWASKHRDTEYAVAFKEARWGYFSRKLMQKLLGHVTPKAMMPGFTDLSEMDAHALVFGVTFNGVSRAYAISDLRGKKTFEDGFNEKRLKLVYDEKSQYLTGIDPLTQKQIIVEKHWWLGWKEFHPQTEIWRA